ncbi:Pyridine nucleotide-disulfide oxidoreductase [Desulfosporosinus orientis DSM 765]|uniref:Pyridine nucleotide-disulfide oxidoreductase n=2 Tax=Desulfosporosinus orientis TaxID=1563 RepID=G7WGX5_DESOD|nr:Pyridine nucleotide-disulfide oxidoreductase [Desulfosporosinus orientis DSM 765]
MLNEGVLVIGGGVAGMQAAIDIAASGREVVLIEKDKNLGGHVKEYGALFPDLTEGASLVGQKVRVIKSNPKITVLLGTEVSKLQKVDGLIKANYSNTGNPKEKIFSAAVIATGFENFDGKKYGEYGYGRFPGVITGIDFEHQEEAVLKKPIQTAVFIKCVGSRDRSKGMPYCSKICCMYTAKQALELKKAQPKAQVYVFYMDIRSNFKNGEEFVRGVMENQHVKYIRGRVGKVIPTNGRLLIRAEDTLMGVPLELEADLVVLATAMVPSPNTPELVTQVGGNLDNNGFIMPIPMTESENPMSLTEGVFYAGACGFPCDVKDALNQGSAAAAGVLSYLQSNRGAAK